MSCVLYNNTTTQQQSSMQTDNKESEPESFATKQELGLTFLGEIYKRLKRSEEREDGTYYCYNDQLFNVVHPKIMINAVNVLLGQEVEESLIQIICFNISSFLTSSREELNDLGLIMTIGANIVVAMHHPDIFSQFPIEKLSIVKLVKVTKAQGLCYEYIYIYLCRYIFFV